jgi:hypothetical protein
MDKAHKLSDTESSAPPSAPFRLGFKKRQQFWLHSVGGSRTLQLQDPCSFHTLETLAVWLFSLPWKAKLFRGTTVVVILIITMTTETPWPESANELHRPSDRRLAAKLMPTFANEVPRGQRDGSLRPYSRLSRPEPLLFLSSSSSAVLTRLSGPHSRPTTSQKNLVAPGMEPGPLDLYPGTLTTRLQRRPIIIQFNSLL